MFKVMLIDSVDYIPRATELSLIRFEPEFILRCVADMFGSSLSASNVVVDERHDEYITITVSGVPIDDADVTLLFVGKREDYTGKLMN